MPRPLGPLPRRLAGIAAAVVGMVALILLVDALTGDVAAPEPLGGAAVVAGEPIPAEAEVFRLDPRDLSTPAEAKRRPTAHPRTLAMYRRLRAFPGAPPRVPHGLTQREFRETRCNTCHRRGGYVERFGAYAPVTPHPEMAACLQCHVADDARVGIGLPTPGRGEPCAQCHVDPDGGRRALVRLAWRPPPWPEPGGPALPGAPPPIPHPLQLRGSCLACHAGPGAVDEILTDHPERVMCRGCHVAVAEVRAGPAGGATAGRAAAPGSPAAPGREAP